MELVTLRSGLILRADAIALALALEALGHTLTAKDGKLLVSNGAALTAEQRAQITQQRLQLLAIAGEIASPADPTGRGDAAR
jgi:hypothetical protein